MKLNQGKFVIITKKTFLSESSKWESKGVGGNTNIEILNKTSKGEDEGTAAFINSKNRNNK